jgi:hypothetical protein
MLATRGCLPFRRVEGNTQSPAWEYVVFCFQGRMKSASNGWSGTGPLDALLFGKPTWPHVQVRCTWIIPSAKLTSCHCKPKHSDIRRPVPAAKSVRVRSGSLRLHTIAYACSGVRIIASYPLVVLLKALKKEGHLANPTLDKTRRVMSLVYKHGQRYGLTPRNQESNPIRFVRLGVQVEVLSHLYRLSRVRHSRYAVAYYALGRQKEADAALSELIAKYHAHGAYVIAQVYAFRKQSNEAFQWLDQAYAQRDSGLIGTNVDPLLKTLHNDPRFAVFLKKIQLPN